MISADIKAGMTNTAPLVFKIIRLEDGVKTPVDITGCSIVLRIFSTQADFTRRDFDASVSVSGASGLFSWLPTPSEAKLLPRSGFSAWRLSITFPNGTTRGISGKLLAALGGIIEVVDTGPPQTIEVVLPLARAGTRNVGTTAERPKLGPDDRFAFYDLTLGSWVRWNGSAWGAVENGTPSDPDPDPGDLTLLFDNRLL